LKLLEIPLNVKSGIENIVGSENSFCLSVNQVTQKFDTKINIDANYYTQAQ